jgi:hypothetical protein
VLADRPGAPAGAREGAAGAGCPSRGSGRASARWKRPDTSAWSRARAEARRSARCSWARPTASRNARWETPLVVARPRGHGDGRRVHLLARGQPHRHGRQRERRARRRAGRGADAHGRYARHHRAPTPNDVGLVVQPLTGPLASAVGAMTGVLVVHVEPGSPADGVLRPGDLIETVDGDAGRIARRAPAADRAPGARHDGQPRRAARRRAPGGRAAARGPGSMRTVPEWPGFTTETSPAGARVRASRRDRRPRWPACCAGDEITLFGDEERPSPRDVERLAAAVEPGRARW